MNSEDYLRRPGETNQAMVLVIGEMQANQDMHVAGDGQRIEQVRKRTKQARKASILLTAIVEASDDPIISKYPNGIITGLNESAEKIFGYTFDEMVGTSILRLTPADRQDQGNHILGKTKRGGSLAHFETLRQNKDGQNLPPTSTEKARLHSWKVTLPGKKEHK